MEVITSNASLLVYIWSIYGNIKTLLFFSVVLLIVISLVAVLLYFIEGESKAKKYIYIKSIIILIIISSLLPPKGMLPYIIAASPVANEIVKSATDKDGKLNKIDKIVDGGLDVAIKAIKDASREK